MGKCPRAEDRADTQTTDILVEKGDLRDKKIKELLNHI